MADTTATKSVLSLVATTSDRVKDLVIKNGQLIFVQDLGRIAFDFKNKRKFYNQIEELDTELTRQTLESPVNGVYYFIIETAVLWTYRNNIWVQITGKPEEIVFIGTEFPALGQAKENTLYVDKAKKEIAIYDGELNDYVVVSNYTDKVAEEDIENLFK